MKFETKRSETMDRINAFQQVMPEEIDAALVVSAVNRQYLTGFCSSDGMLLITQRGAWLFVDFRYFEAAEKQVKHCEVVLANDLKQAVKEQIDALRIKRIGMEEDKITLVQAGQYQKLLGGRCDFEAPVGRLIRQMRRVKTQGELQKIRQAQRIADETFSHMLTVIRAGVCEQEMALEIDYTLRKKGAQTSAFETIVASGPHTSMPHAAPTNRKIQQGDLILMDFGAAVDRYRSDMTRTVALGGYTPEQNAVYQTVLDAQRRVLDALCAGVQCDEMDRLARVRIEEAYGSEVFGHSTGHSVGLDIHEEPRLAASCQEQLASGTVLTVEPGIYLPGQYGVRIEDLVVITADGCENLTKSAKDWIVL